MLDKVLLRDVTLYPMNHNPCAVFQAPAETSNGNRKLCLDSNYILVCRESVPTYLDTRYIKKIATRVATMQGQAKMTFSKRALVMAQFPSHPP